MAATAILAQPVGANLRAQLPTVSFTSGSRDALINSDAASHALWLVHLEPTPCEFAEKGGELATVAGLFCWKRRTP